ncbi:MAG TPA: TolC family protein [Chthoniobacterales bacterium]|nr:TolC family protein [Chthoniobacterales bacterium]
MRKFSIPFLLVAATVAMLPLAPIVFGGTDTIVETRYRTRSAIPRFTLDQAVLTALQRNADIQRARQEIERTKGLYIAMRAEILPQIGMTGSFQGTDPHLQVNHGGDSTAVATPTPSPGASPTPVGSSGFDFGGVERSYNVRLEATQVVFAGGRVVANIRSAAFTRDGAYFAFRNAIDTVVATVKQQFYQVLLNRELIHVQEESVNLLKSQLQDQQNRFEAGTVPRFNVLQAQVALSNQYPLLIGAQNNYRISQLQLAKTLGLDFDPGRGDGPPLEALGQLQYRPRRIPLTAAIEMAKERRPFLKQQKSVVLSNAEQVRVARSGYFPQISASGGTQVRSSAVSEDIHDVSSGYIYGLTGTWAIWDWGATYGAVKQARAVLEQSKITLDDANRQVELEVQQQDSNLKQSAELVRATEQSVGQAQEALRLASARLSAGAGTQLEVLNSRVEVTQSQSNRLQALYNYNVALAEFDRVTATEVTYSNELDEPITRDKAKTDAKPTPAPKPSPLELNHAGNRPPAHIRSTTTTTRTTTYGK